MRLHAHIKVKIIQGIICVGMMYWRFWCTSKLHLYLSSKLARGNHHISQCIILGDVPLNHELIEILIMIKTHIALKDLLVDKHCLAQWSQVFRWTYLALMPSHANTFLFHKLGKVISTYKHFSSKNMLHTKWMRLNFERRWKKIIPSYMMTP